MCQVTVFDTLQQFELLEVFVRRNTQLGQGGSRMINPHGLVFGGGDYIVRLVR